MKTQTKNTLKRTYNVPQIETIKLDNEISLALESDPPILETSITPKYFNNDPFKTGSV
jgi:hypothetical protein